MQEQNIYYVYIHYRLSDGKPFYVGKGKNKRYLNTRKRNAKWKAIENKHGCRCEILFNEISEKEALLLEVDAIAELRYFGYDLANLTNGGESNSGRVVSEETKQKLRERNIGKSPSPETVAKIIAKTLAKKEPQNSVKEWGDGAVVCL